MSTTLEGLVRTIAVTVVRGGAAGDHVLPGGHLPASGALLLSVRQVAAAFSVNGTDRTAEFTITGLNLINNDAGTDTTGDFLVVTYALPAAY